MRINKKKFCVRIFILISIVGLLIYGRFLAMHDEERENLFGYYKDLISSLKGNSSTYVIAEKITSISTDKTQKNIITGRNDGILIANSNGLKEYTINSNSTWSEEFYIANPIIETAGSWTIVAEDNGNRLIAFNSREEAYSLEIEGEVQKIFANPNGYVGVIFAKVGYKNAFSFINSKGDIIYSKYFANTTLIDADISTDGKRVVMLEADTDGAVVNSAITVLDNKADTLNSSIKKNSLLVEVHCFDKNTLIVGDNTILSIDSDYKETVFDEFDSESTIGLLVNDERIVKLYRDTNELFANKTMLQVKNIAGKVIGQSEVEGMAHSVKIQNNTLAIILTDRIDFLTQKGHYISSIFISGDYKDMQLFNNGSYAAIQTNDEVSIYKIR